ncbi:signal recognition particle-docking protein FtsY [Erwinia pyrifoliae]|uniref:signal recognition particle-docking protein FtsY n=1 Tax=Erwinia pyrifoliae TaxID=79967 RepID=UPI00220B7E09|nr:signal recognition particle-docking protein FtsY [Erwinia pyrifoliae]UWS29175.1 signal recognition particle-docking protein FtsY [Erwinia pyrifoliae]
MAKNKKRGFFSWLGLGRDEKAQQEEVKETLEQQPSADTPIADNATDSISEREAADAVAVTTSVAAQQAENSRAGELPEAVAPAEPVVLPVTPDEKHPVAHQSAAEAIDEAELEALALAAEPVDKALAAEVVQEPIVVQPEAVNGIIVPEPEPEPEPEQAKEQERPSKEGFFARLKRSLVKTRTNLGSGFISLFRGKKIDDELFEELEEQLLIADVGVETTRRIIGNLTNQASRKQLRDAEALYGLLKTDMAEILAKVEAPLDISGKTPFVILMVGVNGVGKTTTIGKLARQFQAEGKSVMLAAGDTFRAAAVEQLQVWGQRNNIPVVAQHTGADSASVIFDAIQAAKARHVDVLIADTAGRLQNKAHLMEELKKITRVMKKLDDSAPHEVMLTIDASTGQNAISQTKLFHEAVGLTGITLTKLDGTAKGGVIFSVADLFTIPIRYIGVGEGIDDLRPFKADDFIEALFARED